MFLRELKLNLKSFLLWTISLIILCLLVFLLYKSVISEDNLEKINEVMNSFSPEVLKMFNMDISGIDSAFGWLKTEGMTFIFIISGIYSATLGGCLLLKEKDEGTIEYLNSLPISRNYIVTSKLLVGVIYTVSMLIFLTIFNLCGLALSGEFDIKIFFLLSFSPILPSLILYSFSMLLSTFFRKTKSVFPLSIGIALASYFFLAVSEMSEKVSFFKYISVYTLADNRNIITNKTFNVLAIIISVLLIAIFTSLTYYRYNKKELI